MTNRERTIVTYQKVDTRRCFCFALAGYPREGDYTIVVNRKDHRLEIVNGEEFLVPALTVREK